MTTELLEVVQRPSVRSLRFRFDALPEGVEYRDTGCDLAPACLSCPFAVCRYERGGRPSDLAHAKKLERDALICEMHATGATMDAIRRRFGISRRTVFRVLEEAR